LGGGFVGGGSGRSSGNGSLVLGLGWVLSVGVGGDSGLSSIFVSLGSVGIGNDGGVRSSGVVLLLV